MLEPFLILQLYLLSDKNESTWPISSEIMRSITDKKFGNSLITLGVMEELSDQLINLVRWEV